MPKLEGTISMSRLPPNRGLILNLCFFPVAGADAPAPFGGDPPAEAATDCDKVFEQVDPEKESREYLVTAHRAYVARRNAAWDVEGRGTVAGRTENPAPALLWVHGATAAGRWVRMLRQALADFGSGGGTIGIAWGSPRCQS